MSKFKRIVHNTHTVELVTRANIPKYNLPDQDYLRNKPVLGFVVRGYHADRRTKNGNELVSDAIMKKSFLNIKRNSSEVIQDYPLEYAVLDTGINPGDYVPLDLPTGFDPTQSSIEITGGGAIPAGKSFEITFIYLDPNCKV